MKTIAIDTETTGRLNIPFIATSYDGNRPVLYDMNKSSHWYRLGEICSDPGIRKVFHNATFDIYALSHLGIAVVPPYDDTMIMASMIDEFVETRRLKALAKKFLDEECNEEAELKKHVAELKREAKKAGRTFYYSHIPADILYPYAIKDAEYTYDLMDVFSKKYPQLRQTPLYHLEQSIIPIIVNMEKRGVMIDRDFCSREMARLQLTYDKYIKKIHKKFPGLNINSPKQLRNIVKKCAEDNSVFLVKTKTGEISTGKESLKKLKDLDPLFSDIEKCRRASKMISTYYEPLLNEYTTEEDSTAHFLFYQSSTKTGRFSADLIQTIPKEREDGSDELDAFAVRKAFIVRPGYINFYFDYDQIEMRLFAHFSKNKRLIQAIHDGEDPHSATAIDIFGKLTKETRRFAKTINFGIIYGMGLNALIEKLGVEKREGMDILHRYHDKYKVNEYIQYLIRVLFRQGFIRLDWIGRDYHIEQKFAYKATNYQIQGSAAYIIKLAMKAADKYIRKQEPSANMLMTIHDELVFEVPDTKHKYLDIFVKGMRQAMEAMTLFDVPITADCEYSDTNWGEKNKWK